MNNNKSEKVLSLKEAIKLLGTIVPKRPSRQILRCVLIVGDGATLAVNTCSGDSAAKICTENAEGFAGEIVVPFDVWKKLAGKVPLSTLASSYPVEDFPRYRESAGGVAIGTAWIPAAKRCAPFASTDMRRLALQYVLLERTVVMATDGHILQAIQGEFAATIPEEGAEVAHDFLAHVDPGLLKVILDSCQDGTVSFTAEQRRFHNESIRVNIHESTIRIIMPKRIEE